MKGFTVMYDYRGKVAGIVISALGLAAMVLHRFHPLQINSRWNADQHYGIFEWTTLLGLFLMMYSKEKAEDERTKLIRLKAIQIAFMIMVSTTMAMGFTSILTGAPVTLEWQDLLMFPASGIVLYLLIFHTGLYVDEVWDYEDTGLITNLKNIPANKWGILAYFVVCAVLLLLLAFL